MGLLSKEYQVLSRERKRSGQGPGNQEPWVLSYLACVQSRSEVCGRCIRRIDAEANQRYIITLLPQPSGRMTQVYACPTVQSPCVLLTLSNKTTLFACSVLMEMGPVRSPPSLLVRREALSVDALEGRAARSAPLLTLLC